MKRTRAVTLCALIALGAKACEIALTTAELAANPARAFLFEGKASSWLGWAVSAAGDINGDGFGDFALAAPNEISGTGAVYVVFGRSAEAWESATFNFSVSNTPDPSSWIRISGELANTNLGKAGIVSGDFNGDGLGDLLIGTYNSGKAFCVYGQSSSPWSSFTTAAITNSAVPGFEISGGASSSRPVGNAGDLNGDGIEDMLVVEAGTTSTVHVIFGVSGATRSAYDLDTSSSFSFVDGSSLLGVGGAMGPVGDVNGDGLADLALGSRSFNSNTGRAYVIFARNVSASGQQPWPATLDLASFVDGTNGFIVDGISAGSQIGYTVVGAGDVNADGFADVFIGTSNVYSGGWIVFGHPAPWPLPLNTSQLDGTNGFRFFPAANGETWGMTGGAAGDINGDGVDDFVTGGYQAYGSTALKTGAAAVIFGHEGPWPAELDRTDAVGSLGFSIDGPAASSNFGYSARGAGDVNGDGIADFIVGAYAYAAFSGYATLVFGTPDDHCAVCSNTTEVCLACDDSFFLNSTSACEAVQPVSSSVFSASTSTQPGASSVSTSTASSSSSSFQSAAVVVIEIGGGGSATEVAEEVAQLLGVDVGQISVVEITPGTFEVTVINEEVAQQLVTFVELCIEEEAEAK